MTPENPVARARELIAKSTQLDEKTRQLLAALCDRIDEMELSVEGWRSIAMRQRDALAALGTSK